MTLDLLEISGTAQENEALQRFKAAHPELFRKNDAELFQHIAALLSILVLATLFTVLSPWIPAKILFGAASAFCWFSLINVTIHHHTTHRNAASGPAAKKVLDILYWIAVPNAGKRKTRYTRAHMNHHFRPFHETDVDHHYGTERFLCMMKKTGTAILYYLELTFVGGHMPGWMDDQYMNEVPLEKWNTEDYKKLKLEEVKKARQTAVLQWGGFLLLASTSTWGQVFRPVPIGMLSAFAWAWIFPMLLVKNWAHFLGQFQHYEPQFLEKGRSLNQRTRTYRVSSWINYLTGGELSGHFLHHLYPEMPYYHVESARQLMASDPELSKLFILS